jgi:signal transduction histidine kinase
MLKYIRWIIPRRIASQIAALIVGSIFIHVILLGAIAIHYFGAIENNPLIQSEPSFVRTVFLTRMIAATKNHEQRLMIINAARAALPGVREENYANAILLIPNEPDGVNSTTGWFSFSLPYLQTEVGMKFKIGANLETPDDSRVMVAFEDGFAMSFLIPSELQGGFPVGFNLLAVLGSFVIVLMVISVWAARRLGSPLSKLAEAASNFDADQPFVAISEKGPTEVVKVARAFNQMGQRTSQLVEDRTHLVAAVSHDLRTPITRLRLRAESSKDKDLQVAMLADLGVMDRMVHSALSFVRDMRADHKLQRIELTSLMQAICDDYYDTGRNVIFDPQLRISAFCNQDQISRAVINVIDNALKFGTSAEVQLSKVATNLVEIAVIDDGPGIPDAQKSIVLKPFQRGDQARSSADHEGFGLGLSICAAITKSHCGSIILEDVQPHGLKVRIRLPMGDEKSPPAA